MAVDWHYEEHPICKKPMPVIFKTFVGQTFVASIKNKVDIKPVRVVYNCIIT